MTWLLVYIVLSNQHGIDVGQVGSYSTMVECFQGREELLLQVTKGESENFPVNQQAICIRTDVGF